MKLVLIGYMGSGKSTIGRKLATILDINFIDLDDYIQLKEGLSISEIFNLKGEIYFRKIENKYLSELLTNSYSRIISVGGGTPCYGNNMKLILESKKTRTIYLKATIPTLVERLQKEQNTRPLIAHIKTKNELSEFIGKHLFERVQFYNQSDLTITIDSKNVDEIFEEIILKLF